MSGSEVETESEANSSSTCDTIDPFHLGQLRKAKVKAKLARSLREKSAAVRTHKAIYGDLVKTFWGCRLADGLPVELKPRVRAANGKRVGPKQQDTKHLSPLHWTKNMLHALERLASLTPDDKTCAHVKLLTRVKRRQREGTHIEYYAREVLPSDIEAVVQELKHLKAIGRYPPKPKRTLDSKKKGTGDLQLAEGQWQEVHLKVLMKAPGEDEAEPGEDDGPWQGSSTSSERKAAIASELEYLDRKASDVDEQTDSSSHQSIEGKLQDREQQDEEYVEGKASLQESPMTKKRKTIVLAHKHSSKRGKGCSGSGK
ncbi:hypothetical protein LTR56_006870 [Elasticomyces elasticus]|nr:hypothetical protein LTR56_006870 [Elasticomyces elasticus]KAK5748305.1 hypothetical protein LTS12_021644 [Elasticomyces elasticus]